VEHYLEGIGGHAVFKYDHPICRSERRGKNQGEDRRVHELIEEQACPRGAMTDIGCIRIVLILPPIDFLQAQATTSEHSVCTLASASNCRFATGSVSRWFKNKYLSKRLGRATDRRELSGCG
jgi:hypothetical protein